MVPASAISAQAAAAAVAARIIFPAFIAAPNRFNLLNRCWSDAIKALLVPQRQMGTAFGDALSVLARIKLCVLVENNTVPGAIVEQDQLPSSRKVFANRRVAMDEVEVFFAAEADRLQFLFAIERSIGPDTIP